MNGMSLSRSNTKASLGKVRPGGARVVRLVCALMLGGAVPLLEAAEQVKDINYGSVGSSPEEVTVYNNKLYFMADDGINGAELWASDGTDAGTTMLKDINSGSGASSPYGFTVFNSLLYFGADDGTNGQELWVTDGTSAGTTLVEDINPGIGGSSPSDLTVSDGKLYFQADDGMTGPELWVLDPAASCDFPLDASEQVVVGSGFFDGRLALSNHDQTGTYVIESQRSTDTEWGMFPDGTALSQGQAIPVDSGIHAVAMSLDDMPAIDISPDLSSGDVVGKMVFVDQTTLNEQASVAYGKDGTGCWVDLADDGGYAYTNCGQISINFDADNGNEVKIGYTDTNGMPQILDTSPTSYVYASSKLVPVLFVREQPGVDSSYANKPVEVSFVSTAAEITAPVLTGAKDACGNDI